MLSKQIAKHCRYGPFIDSFQRSLSTSSINCSLSSQQAIFHRANLFSQEKERQLKKIERVEKIEVKIVDSGNVYDLMMNKNLSTPRNCAMHISELFVQRSVLAQVNDQLWDMCRPLENDCELRFLHFKDLNPLHVNNAFWRSCSFLLGFLLETAFKDNLRVELCSFPPPDIKSGSFIYDALLDIPNWKPTREELRCLSIAASKLISQDLKFERLKVKREIAEEMFKYNKFKLEQIPSIIANQKAKSSSDNESDAEYITVYKLGDFVDISKGPMINSISQIGRFEVTGIFDMDTENYGRIHRIQGVAIPKQLNLHNWTFNLLAERASRLNTSALTRTPKKVQNQVKQ